MYDDNSNSTAELQEDKLFVGGLPWATNEEDLKTLFSGAGTVVSTKVVVDREKGNRSKGFGFVQMSSAAEAQKAIEMFNDYELDGRKIRVAQAEKPKQREYSKPY